MRFKLKKDLGKDTTIKKFAFLPKRMPCGDLIWLEFYEVVGYWFIGPVTEKIIFCKIEILDNKTCNKVS